MIKFYKLDLDPEEIQIIGNALAKELQREDPAKTPEQEREVLELFKRVVYLAEVALQIEKARLESIKEKFKS